MNIRSAVIIHFDTTCMYMTVLHLLILYDQNAFKMQRMSVLAYGNLLCKVTSTHLLTFSSVCNYIKQLHKMIQPNADIYIKEF